MAGLQPMLNAGSGPAFVAISRSSYAHHSLRLPYRGEYLWVACLMANCGETPLSSGQVGITDSNTVDPIGDAMLAGTNIARQKRADK